MLFEYVMGIVVIVICYFDDKMVLDKFKGVNIIWIDENYMLLYESL